MDLYQEILLKMLERGNVQVTFSNLNRDPAQIVETECYRTLKKIKAVIEDDSLDDAACYLKIEEIVRLFEELGSGGGNRHDFG